MEWTADPWIPTADGMQRVRAGIGKNHVPSKLNEIRWTARLLTWHRVGMRSLRSLMDRGLGRTLGFSVLAELCAPTLWALFGLTALVLTKDLLGFSDLVVNRGLGMTAVGRIAFYEVVPLLSRTLPFAVLVGCLVGLGRLRADRELLALQAAGVAREHVLVPVLGFAALLSVVGLGFSLFSAPAAVRALDVAMHDMFRGNPGVTLRPGTVHVFGDARLVAREVSPRGDRLRGVLLWVSDASRQYLAGDTLFAEHADVQPLRAGVARLRLSDGVILLPPDEGGGETRFQTFETDIREAGAPDGGGATPLAGLSMSELRAHIATLAGDAARRAHIEWHRRFASPMTCLAFGLLAVPLAFTGRHFSRASGGVAGLAITTAYYGVTQFAEGLIQAGAVSVGLGVWLPHLLVGLAAAGLIGIQNRSMARPLPDWLTLRRKVPAAARGSSLRSVLTGYVVRRYLLMILLAFGGLFVGYLLVDVLERLDWFARYRATPAEALQFYSVRAPLLAARVVPMALLLAAALTVSVMSRHRELIAMRACGVAVERQLACILVVAGLAVPLSFALNEYVVPRTNAAADRIKITRIKDRGLPSGVLQKIVWYRAGSRVSQATQLDPRLGSATDVSVYELGAQGLPVSRTDARRAVHVGDGMWELVEPVRIRIADTGLHREPGERLIRLGPVPDTSLDTMHLGVRQLAREIAGAAAAGYDVTTYRVDLNVKLARPLACLVLPAVLLFFVLLGPPFPGPALTLLGGILLGVGYVLFTGVCAALGYGGTLPPVIAGWGPPLSLGLLAGWLAWRGAG